ncbi:MAG: hypothetical protein OEM29_04265 [Thermoplasmata archaeon]|nr:hypothetical protein [Thermoplasmata archaeon]
MENVPSSDSVPALLRWMEKWGKAEARKDKIVGANIIGEAVAAVFLSALLWFFVAHKLEETGFYTDEFGILEMTLMYSAGFLAVALAVLRVIIRRRNMLRPLDMASFVLFAIAHAVLLVRFPFDFGHVADVLPSSLQWTVEWMTDTIGALILALGIVGGIVGALVTLLIYLGVREGLRSSAEQQTQPPMSD